MTQTNGTPSVTVDGILFDMDGTLLDSTPAVNATWEQYAREFNLDLEHVLKTSHGQRSIDNMRIFCKITEPEALHREVVRFETMIVDEAQRLKDEGKRGLVVLPGVVDMLTTLNAAPSPVWAIVTSATRKYASRALATGGIPPYPALVTADDVSLGKPDPEPYLAGAKKLRLDPARCIVVEDAPTGIKSGVACGAQVLAVCTSHPREELEGLGAAWIVDDLTKVQVEVVEGGVKVTIVE
ncbi:glycerol-1-phosphatase [Cutaneotrichosporon oleaginosum]|uniref:Glycerol-1-phosphatase n=1 Tax=Cutaneotrichosporon oleaginosum TaxID=879819 RepID=A0A0J0XYQ1_9TREE|nr:glycerol-1-phosphatase [Cutaneotrichosporon oleaginosum]KLT46180.1 glycerol-1-phosphatase [Cutaneotrichosporon oleaginosum]TXT10189.1 hypothetical protein COLE_04123 [Cutaneotrichosporon oleaginosum]